jgi:spore maturation protein B
MKYLNNISFWSVPLIIVVIISYAYIKGVNVYDAFTEGASEGIKTVIKIIPYLLAMMLAIRIFLSSGAMEILLNLFNNFIPDRIPEEVVPLLFLRPLSGSGSLSYVSHLLKEYGPDSFIGKLASTIQGSSETTFYIVAIYFGSIGIKKYRYAISVGLMADIAGFFAAVFVSNLLF